MRSSEIAAQTGAEYVNADRHHEHHLHPRSARRDAHRRLRVGAPACRRRCASTSSIGLPSARPFASGELADAVDYAAVVERIKALAATNPHALLERFAESVAQLVLGEFGAPSVKVRVAKLAPLPGVRELGVQIERKAATDD